MEQQAYSVSTQSSRSHRQYWMRRESPPSFFSWPAWLWMLGLLLLLIWGVFVTAPNIERDIERNVSQQLAADNSVLQLSDADVLASGQHVSITASGSSEREALTEAIASATQCDTYLFGELRCPARVSVAVSEAEIIESTTVTIEQPAAVVARSHDFVLSGDQSGLLLEGDVSSENLRQAIERQLSQIHSRVENQLRVSGEPSSGEDAWAANQAGQLLGLAENGRVTWQNGVLTARVLAKAENSARIRSVFDLISANGQHGELELQEIETVSRCDAEFAKLLSENSIRFQTGSATVSAQSAQLLAIIAELAANCDMRLDVEGHTDSVGSAELNKSLSLARANAVIESLVAYGATAERFTAYGYGPDRPVADNGTADGRRLNRRIEIRVTKIN